MKEKRRKNRCSAVLSLFLAAVLLVGSLPLTGFTVHAADQETAEEQQENAAERQTKADASSGRFKHPGMMHSAVDLAKAWENVQNNVSPNKETWDQLWWDAFSNPNWNPRPMEIVTRGVPGANIGQFCIDVKRAYQNALIWKLSGDEAHGATAVRVVNAYSSILKQISGTQDRFLVSGIQGYQLANIGELLRDHPDFDLKGLQNLLLNVFYPMNQDFMIRHNDTYVGSYWANWELANLASMISIGVFCDREDIYEQALNFFKYGKGNGSFYHAMPFVLEQDGNELVQWQESVRDQGHTTLGLLLTGIICETAWNQGDDLYGLSDNRFMKAAEYAIKYNQLGQEAPSSWYMRVSGNLKSKPKLEYYAGLNPYQRGNWRPIYYQMYNHYVNRKGVEMPCAEQMIKNSQGVYMEGASGTVTDQLGWYSLTYANTGERAGDKPIQGELTDGVYRIVSALSGKSLVTSDDGELATAPKGSSKDEWWLIKNRGDGEYTITSMGGAAVQINGQDTEDREVNGVWNTYSKYYLEGSTVGTGTADGSRKQRFAFLKDDDGLFRIVPSMTYYVWSLKDNNAGDNVKIHQWFNDASGQYNNDSSLAQRWIFEKATEVGTEFTFDEESTGFCTTYAEAEGTYTLEEHGEGRAAALDGSSQFLTIKAKTGKSVLAGETAFTVTCEVKPDAGNSGWIFYASPREAQSPGKETYLGIKEENGTITAVSCKDGTNSASVSAAGREDWYQLSVVYDGAELILYINGQEKGSQKGTYQISDMLPEDTIVQIGKANLESGKYYKGQIDNLKITGHAMTEGEVIQSAGTYAAQEMTTPEVLADFTFDDEQTGFTGGAAEAKGVYSLADHGDGKALYLNGYKDYLKVTGRNGGSVAPGGLVEEMTISVQAKRDGGEFGWVFYAAPDDNSPMPGREQCLGVIDNESQIVVQRNKEGLSEARAEAKAGRWHYLTIVYTRDSILIYEDGEKKGEAESNASLSEILGSDSVWYIGKANYKKAINREKGEHFRGWIDNYKVISRAWTEEEIKTEARKYVDKSILQKTVENQTAEDQSIYAEERWQDYQTALANAREALADETALQSAVDSAEEPLSRVQAWMRMDEALYAQVEDSAEALYTAKTWEPYAEALAKARAVNENENASNQELEEAAKKLKDAQSDLLKKTETVLKAVQAISDIGIVEQTPESSRKVILARQICTLLTEEELESVANLQDLEQAEAALSDYLAEFTFDDEETGFMGGQAVANAHGACEIKNGALYLDGTSSNWLDVVKGDGSSLLTGQEELTFSFAAKPESEKGNWLMFASSDDSPQENGEEHYLGLLEFQGAFSAERFLCHDGSARPETAYIGGVETSKWLYVTLVHTPEVTIIYINGEEKARTSSETAIPDILGQESILHIGRANWGTGEYYKGYIDHVKIMGKTMSAEEIKAEAENYLDRAVEPKRVEDVVKKIDDIGKVELNSASRTKIQQARSAYNELNGEEKKLVTNADMLFSAEILYEELADPVQKTLAEFTFDNTENGFLSSGAKAQPSSTPVIVQDEERGNVLSLDGTGSVWLNVVKKDGTPLLTDTEEVTISYYSKIQQEGTNWVYFAAPDSNEQIYNKEYYIAALEGKSNVIAERYLNGRPGQDTVWAERREGWNHIAVVYSTDDMKVYVNGIHAGTANNSGELKQILGESSIFQIGKANWHAGEYYQGLLDDFAVYNYACSERQVQILAGVIADPKEIKEHVQKAKAISKDGYTEESYTALQNAIRSAQIAYHSVTTQEEVSAAVNALQQAVDNLQKITPGTEVNKKPLEDKIAEAKKIQKDNYTEESYTALQDAVKKAEETLKTVKTEAEVTAAAAALQKAIDSLQKNIQNELDTKPLTDKITEAQAIQKGNYTEESYAALQTAIETARSALKTVKTESEVTAAAEALQRAIDSLQENTPGTELNKKPLEDKIAEAKKIEKGEYTDASYAALQNVIQKAEEMLKKGKTQEELSQALAALSQAVSNLSKKPGTPGKPDEPEKPGDPGDPEKPGKPEDSVILVKGITLTPAQKKLTVGQEFTLQAAVTPDDASNKNLKVTSSNSKVAEVSGMKVTAKGTGRAVITVFAQDGSGTQASMVVDISHSPVVKIKAVQQKTTKNVIVSFDKVSGAAGYDIYRSTNGKKGYKKIGSTTKTRYVDKKAKTAKTYYYKIVVKARDKNYHSVLSTKYAKRKVLACPSIKVQAQGGRTAQITWKKLKGAKGYVVYTSTKKNKGFKAAKTLKKAKAVKAAVKVQKKSIKKLYIKVRPYYTEKGKKIYGPYSKTKAVKLKK